MSASSLYFFLTAPVPSLYLEICGWTLINTILSNCLLKSTGMEAGVREASLKLLVGLFSFSFRLHWTGIGHLVSHPQHWSSRVRDLLPLPLSALCCDSRRPGRRKTPLKQLCLIICYGWGLKSGWLTHQPLWGRKEEDGCGGSASVIWICPTTTLRTVK